MMELSPAFTITNTSKTSETIVFLDGGSIRTSTQSKLCPKGRLAPTPRYLYLAESLSEGALDFVEKAMHI